MREWLSRNLTKDIDIRAIRLTFDGLIKRIKEISHLSGFRFIELEIPQAVTNLKIPHSLGYVPKDVIQLRLTGAGALTWNYTLFDETNLDITTTGACTVRAFVGTYVQGDV